MKRVFIIGITIGMVFGCTIAGVVAYNYSANDISYSPKDNTWAVNDVKGAIDDLYESSIQDKIILWANSLLWGNGSYAFVNLSTDNNQLTKINNEYFVINDSGQIIAKKDIKVKIANYVNPTNNLQNDSKIKTEVNGNVVVEVNGGRQIASYASEESNAIELKKEDVISLYQQGGVSNCSAYSWLIYLSK